MPASTHFVIISSHYSMRRDPPCRQSNDEGLPAETRDQKSQGIITFIQVAIFPIVKIKNRNDGTCCDQHFVQVLGSSFYTGNFYTEQKFFYPVLKFLFIDFIQLLIKRNLCGQYISAFVRYG